MAPRETEESSCHVEISGWDQAENFFVEKTMLRRFEDGSQKVLLHASLRVGALVFARLTDEQIADRSSPITYEVATIDSSPSFKGREVQLTQRDPKKTLFRGSHTVLFDDAMKN
ncbi:MAG: hypothetical protein ACRD4V_04855 [Candidatus Acidiferrales bacterium]